MKKKLFVAITLVFTLCFSSFAKQNLDDTLVTISSDIAARCEQREIIAILDFSSATQEMSSYLNSQLISIITQNTTLQIVTRQHMDKIERELKFQSSGLVSDSTALSIGERLGAHEIIFGTLEELDNKYMLQVRMLNVSHASYSLFKTYEINRSSKTEQLLGHAATIYKTSLGAVAEMNKNSISYVAPAAGITFDYSIFRRLSLGLKVLVSYDFFETDNSILAIEPLGSIRWYAVSPTGEPSAGVFVEGQGGADLIMVNSSIQAVPSIGLELGFRIPLLDFYFEPYLRGGYPYLFGAGISTGLRF